MRNEVSELERCYSEALKDSRSLQALADDLLDTLIRTQRELTEANLSNALPSCGERLDILHTLGK